MSGMGPIGPGISPGSGNIEQVTKSGATPGSVLLSDQNKIIVLDNTTNDVTLTVEQDSVTDLPIDSWFYVAYTGTGQATLSRGGSVVFDTVLGDVDIKINKPAATNGALGSLVWFWKKSANLWWIFGPIKPAA
jgi:hypothetical protein